MNGNGEQSINFQRNGLILHGGPLSSTDPPSTMNTGSLLPNVAENRGKESKGKGKSGKPRRMGCKPTWTEGTNVDIVGSFEPARGER